MKFAFDRFNNLIEDTKKIDVLTAHLEQKGILSLINLDDLLRWQWVQCVSVFDTLVHDLVRIGFLEIYRKKRSSTEKYKNFQIPLEQIETMLELIKSDYDAGDGNVEDDCERNREKIIIVKHSYFSFQDPQKVLDALSLIWDSNAKMACIASKMQRNEQDCRTIWKSIILRRNQIVHQGDYQDPHQLQRGSITLTDVQDTRKFASL